MRKKLQFPSTAVSSRILCAAKDCRMKHTMFLHVNRGQRVESESRVDSRSLAGSQQAAGPGPSAVCSHIKSTFPRVVLPVVEVRVTAESGHSATTYALLDNGSTNTFCSTALLHKLRSRGQKASLGLTTPKGEDSKFKTSVQELEVLTPKVNARLYSTPSLCKPIDSSLKFLCRKARWLRQMDTSERRGHPGDIRWPDSWEAYWGRLSWASHTPRSQSQRATWCNVSTLRHHNTVWVDHQWSIRRRSNWPGSSFLVNFVTLEQQVEQFWNIEGAQLNNSHKGLSAEDRKALDIMQESIRK